MPSPTEITLFGPLVLIGLALFWGFARILHLRKSSGVKVLAAMGRKRSLPEACAGAVGITLDLYLIARPFCPQLDGFVMAWPHAYSHWGVILMAIGILIAVISQVDMGRSWRIGLPPKGEESMSLVTGGLYQFSRNPIYVGIMLFVIGSLVLVPGPLTIAATLLSWVFINQIIREEEAFLDGEFSEAYQSYKARVRRWL